MIFRKHFENLAIVQEIHSSWLSIKPSCKWGSVSIAPTGNHLCFATPYSKHETFFLIFSTPYFSQQKYKKEHLCTYYFSVHIKFWNVPYANRWQIMQKNVLLQCTIQPFLALLLFDRQGKCLPKNLNWIVGSSSLSVIVAKMFFITIQVLEY